MKNSLILATFLLALAVVNNRTSVASAVMQIKGKIVSFSADEVVVETAKSIYKLDRKALSKPESDAITRSEVQATFSVPMSAIKNVEARKKK